MQKFSPTLDKAAFPLKQIRDSARRTLLDLLDSVRGRKALVLESDFASPLGLIAEALTLKEHGVEMFCVLDGQPSVVDALVDRGVRHVVYLVRARLEVVQAVVQHVRMCQSSGRPFEYTLLLAPRRTAVAQRLLEESGLAGDVAVRDFPLDWVPLDEDLLSLEMPHAFRELSVEQDSSCLYDIARALMALQQLHGTIPHVKGKGVAAAGVHRVMARMRQELGKDAPAPAGAGGIDTLIILDRSVDMATPLLTQLTYEGLLDEVLGLNCGQARLESEGQPRKVYGLNSADAVFKETRDKFYMATRKWLNETLRSFQQFRDQGIHSADIPTLRGFVTDLKEKFSRLPLHTQLVDTLAASFQSPGFLARQKVEAGLLDEGDEMAAIEELMYCGEPLEVVLRLLCLYCAVHGGVPKKYFDPLRRDLLNTYGHHHLLTLAALAKAGLLQRREGRRSSFGQAKQAFHLLLQEGEAMSEDSPTDIHFAYAGYASLSVRIVQQALTAGWGAVDSVLATLPGPQFEVLQTTDESGTPVEQRDSGKLPGDRRRTVMVLFIGGVTYAEVSALRFLSSKGLVNADFVVGTTKMVNGSTLLGSLVAKSAEDKAAAAPGTE